MVSPHEKSKCDRRGRDGIPRSQRRPERRGSLCSQRRPACFIHSHTISPNFMRKMTSPEAIAHWLLPGLRGEARVDRRQCRRADPVRHVPDGRGRGVEGIVPGNPAADRRIAPGAGQTLGTRTVGCIITMGGGRLNCEEKPQSASRKWNAGTARWKVVFRLSAE
jgi:hypothetical protein